MTEIKRYDGRVLYTAKDASDVRTAVEEAVRSEANLSRADLRRADLSRADLRGANLCGADLRRANLSRADLRRANLSRADLRTTILRGADLSRADLRTTILRGADLRGANLRGANLYGANLSRADLRGAKGYSSERTNPLLILREQVGKIRAYKLVTAELRSPIQPNNKITYEIGSTVEAKADPDEMKDCGAGINLASLPWCLENLSPGHRILVCEFTAKDIAAIPDGGKFRVHKARVVKEYDLAGLLEREAA